MQTIFDFNPTETELKEIGFYSFPTMIHLHHAGAVTREIYLSKVSPEWAIFDIAMLHQHRKLDASEYWRQIPELYLSYVRGLDCKAVPEK